MGGTESEPHRKKITPAQNGEEAQGDAPQPDKQVFSADGNEGTIPPKPEADLMLPDSAVQDRLSDEALREISPRFLPFIAESHEDQADYQDRKDQLEEQEDSTQETESEQVQQQPEATTAVPRERDPETDESSEQIRSSSSTEREAGVHEDTPKTNREQVKELREKGLTSPKIAEELGLSRKTVDNYIYQFLKSGDITPRIKRANSEGRREQVKELRNQGLTNARIADEVGVSKATVDKYVSQLLMSGDITRRTKSGESNRDQVRTLRNQGFTNPQIADELGISYYAVKTYASELLKSGEIAPQRRGPKPSGDIFPTGETPTD